MTTNVHSSSDTESDRASAVLSRLQQIQPSTIPWNQPPEDTIGRLCPLDDPIWRHIGWYGVLELWRHDPAITDIFMNGSSGDRIFLLRSGVKTPAGGDIHPRWIAWVAQQLLRRSRRSISDHAMQLGTVDMMRYALTLPPITSDITISIRILPKTRLSIEMLARQDVMSDEALAVVLQAIRIGATILVSGPTGSGKTTLLAALMSKVQEWNQRVIVVEDTPELPVSQHDVVHLTVPPSYDGRSFAEAISFTLRQRPDRIIVGEIRSGEALAFLQAAISGHPAMATIHAPTLSGAALTLERLGMIGLAMQTQGGGSAALVRGMMTSESLPLLIVQMAKYRVTAIGEMLRDSGAGRMGDPFPINVLFQRAESGTLERQSWPQRIS